MDGRAAAGSREQSQPSPLKFAGPLPHIGVIGVGAVGATLASALAACGYPIVALAGRASSRAAWLAERLPSAPVVGTPTEVVNLAELVILAVPDDALASVVAELPWRAGQAVVHCSGATPAQVLAAAGERGALYGSFHPLLSIPRLLPSSAEEVLARLEGCTFAIEAPPPLAAVLERMASAFQARAVMLEERDRVPYHLAAVLTANYTVTLLAAATDLWANFGATREEALVALLPLLRSTLANLAQVGLAQSFTGPIARGDLGTVFAHLMYVADQKNTSALNANLLDELYRTLGLLSLPLARAKGRITEEQLSALEEALKNHHQPS
jgi:predicted short-subunit dehydrogenase-like oxidoreductase (DUF2520 family)